MEPDEDELIARVRSGRMDPSTPLPNGQEPARFAIRQLMPRLLRVLLDAGANPTRTNACDQPLLHQAIEMWETGAHGWAAEAVPQMIDALLAAGARLDERGDNDFTPLHVAALRSNEAICRQLMRAGADVMAVAEATDSEGGQTPGEVAESYNRRGVAAILREALTPDQLERRRRQKAEARKAYLQSLRRGGP